MNAIPLDRLRELIRLDASSPSGLVKISTGKPALAGKSGCGYLCGILDKVQLRAHRVVYALYHDCWPIGDVDHIDGDKLNNCPDNLRDVPSVINSRNLALRSNNTSGYPGVYERKPGKWSATIRRGALPRKYLHGYSTAAAAHEARLAYLEIAHLGYIDRPARQA